MEQLNGEIGGYRGQRLRPGRGGSPQVEELLGGMVAEADVTAGIAHQHTDLHVLDDERVDLSEVGEVHAAPLGQCLGGAQPLGEHVAQKRRGNEADAQHPHLWIALAQVQERCNATGEVVPGVLQHHGNSGERGIEHGNTSAEHEAATGDGNEQQHAKTARQSTAGVHQYRQQCDIGEGEQRGVGFEIETSWRSRKHIKGDIFNLQDLSPSLGVIVLCCSANDTPQEIESLRSAAKRYIVKVGLRILVWSDSDVDKLLGPR